MMAGALSVSPREVVDMVHRASRVEGCSAGLADRVAADIAFCEVHHGAGIAAWLGLVDRSLAHLVEAVRSAYRLDLAVIEVRATGAGRQAWEPAIPFALAARSLYELAGSGVRWAGEPDGVSGTDLLDSVDLVAGECRAGGPDPFSERSRSALASGLTVDATLWSRLEVIAADFLMSEAVLDAAMG